VSWKIIFWQKYFANYKAKCKGRNMIVKKWGYHREKVLANKNSTRVIASP
jgi:hypothetical protein